MEGGPARAGANVGGGPARAGLQGRTPRLRLRRALPAALAVGLLLGTLVAATSGEEDGYRVRAIFDNASFVIPGEDVKVAGVVVGAIDDVDLTRDNRAAVVLKIDDPAFQPFRRDAHCQIRLQSLIGEQFIECEPTRAHEQGGPLPPPLREIESGDGEGQHLLPVDNTTTPINVDLINNIYRLPHRERWRLIISELGAGLAGNGERLRAAVRRANPALRELDRVIATLAEQDRLLARLVDESDTVLKPWAARRKETAGFIDHAGATAAAAAERGEDIERNFERLPPFLRELGPTADRFSAFADQMTPAMEALQANAPAINESIARLGPFTDAARPAVTTLGDFAQEGRRVFPAVRPLVRDLRDLSRPLRPLSNEMAEMFGSFDDAGGVEELMRFIFFYTSAVNGEDALGHYVRSGLNLSNCVRSGVAVGGCEATFDPTGQTIASAASAVPREPEALLDYLLGPEEESR
jgi:phospholipid/cholesterol/gamma-HCH transport system substrate-binding protein